MWPRPSTRSPAPGVMKFTLLVDPSLVIITENIQEYTTANLRPPPLFRIFLKCTIYRTYM